MKGVAGELSVFLSACLSGNLICLIYGALCVFRRIIKHKLFWISVEDFMFWIGIALYLFLQMYRACAGSIRWYFVCGVLAGGFLTGQLLQKLLKRLDKKIKTK